MQSRRLPRQSDLYNINIDVMDFDVMNIDVMDFDVMNIDIM